MMGEKKAVECELAVGVCPYHEIETERRKSDRTRMSDLKDDIEENRNNIGVILTFQNICKGFSLLGAVFIIGSYSYTYTHSVSADLHMERTAKAAMENREEITQLKVQMAVTQANVANMVTKLEDTNRSLGHLVEIIEQDRTDRRLNGFAHPPTGGAK